MMLTVTACICDPLTNRGDWEVSAMGFMGADMADTDMVGMVTESH